MKRRFDITYTVALSEKAYKRLGRSEARADEAGENFPLWDIGLAAVDGLSLYGVKAKLVRWGCRRNADDLERETREREA